MSDLEQPDSARRVVGLKKWNPTATGGRWEYRGQSFNILPITSVKRSVHLTMMNLSDNLLACKSIIEQSDLCIDLIRGFVPDAPVEALRDESFDDLFGTLLQIAGDDTNDEVRPTPGRKKTSTSASRSRKSRTSTPA